MKYFALGHPLLDGIGRLGHPLMDEVGHFWASIQG
jgi:hypothetical protein